MKAGCAYGVTVYGPLRLTGDDTVLNIMVAAASSRPPNSDHHVRKIPFGEHSLHIRHLMHAVAHTGALERARGNIQ